MTIRKQSAGRLTGILTAVLLVCSTSLGPAADATLVEFESATTPPSKFQIKRAKAKGINLTPEPGFPIRGLLRLPEGVGPFPALVLLHDCQGMQPYQNGWAVSFTRLGYATLQVDSFGPRNLTSTCQDVLGEGLSGLGGERVMDAFGALNYLENHPKVDATRIGAVGWSRSSTTGSALRDGSRQFFDRGFRAVVSFYPNCNSVASAVFADPILLLVAGKDDWTDPDLCRRLASEDPNVQILEFPGSLHGFDDPKWSEQTVMHDFQNTRKEPAFGVTFGFDEHARRQAGAASADFLEKHLQ